MVSSSAPKSILNETNDVELIVNINKVIGKSLITREQGKTFFHLHSIQIKCYQLVLNKKGKLFKFKCSKSLSTEVGLATTKQVRNIPLT